MAKPERIELEIRGMTCGHCVTAVRKGLSAVPGVSDVSVTLDPPRAVLTLDRDKAQLQDLLAAVREAGYSASGAELARGAPPAGAPP